MTRHDDHPRTLAYILGGTLWSLKQQYKDRKTREYEGDNMYPRNYGELCRPFGLEWNRYKLTGLKYGRF